MARKKIPTTQLELELREEVRLKFLQAMKERGLTTQAEAAREIGITKAAFGLYLNQKSTPSAFILLKACEKWGLSIRYGGILFSAADFAQAKPRVPSSPEQPSLFGAIDNLQPDDVAVAIEKKEPKAVDIRLSIRFGT